MHLNDLAAKVKEGVRNAGLVGYRFNTIGVSDGISMGTAGMSYSLQSRDIIADSIETVRASSFSSRQVHHRPTVPLQDRIHNSNTNTTQQEATHRGNTISPQFSCSVTLRFIWLTQLTHRRHRIFFFWQSSLFVCLDSSPTHAFALSFSEWPIGLFGSRSLSPARKTLIPMANQNQSHINLNILPLFFR